MNGSGITTIKDLIEVIAYIVGSLSLLVAAITYYLSKNQFQHDVMLSCIERFQEILLSLAEKEPEKRLRGLHQYIDLCNEELFYFKSGYIPGEVEMEWLDGMISYLPLFDKQGNVRTQGKYREILECNLLADYPRIKKAFRLSMAYDLSDTKQRMEAISEVQKNLKHFNFLFP